MVFAALPYVGAVQLESPVIRSEAVQLDTACNCPMDLPSCQYGCTFNWDCYDTACVAYTVACADAAQAYYACEQTGSMQCLPIFRAAKAAATATFDAALLGCCDC